MIFLSLDVTYDIHYCFPFCNLLFRKIEILEALEPFQRGCIENKMNTQGLRNSLTGRKKSVVQLVEQWEEIPVKTERVS